MDDELEGELSSTDEGSDSEETSSKSSEKEINEGSAKSKETTSQEVQKD